MYGREEGTPHIVFVIFNFRGSLVRRTTGDVIPPEKAWNLAY